MDSLGIVDNFFFHFSRILWTLFELLVLRAQEELGAVLWICLGGDGGKRKSDVDFDNSYVEFQKCWSLRLENSIGPFSELRRS